MHGRSFWALILILIGVALLLNNFGLLPGNVWELAWPLVLIVLGLSFIVGRQPGPRRARSSVEEALALDGATSARVTVSHGGGRLLVTSGAPSDQLYAGRFGGAIARKVRRVSDQLEVSLRPAGDNWQEWSDPGGWGDGQGRLDWTIAFNAAVPLTLSFETGAAKTDLDLSNLKVVELSLQTGVSATTVAFPTNAGATRAVVKAGVASVHLRIPDGVAARIVGQMGLGALNVDERRFPRNGKLYASADYTTAANRIDLNIEGGLGAIDVGQLRMTDSGRG
jgi:hypothetical protein